MTAPGPAALGRGVIVDGAGSVPPAWEAAPTVVVDQAVLDDPSTVVTELHAAWFERRPVVVRLEVDAGAFRAPRSYDAEPWTLPAGFEVWHDRLQFVVWANNYDARQDPGRPVWWWARKAERLGARPAGPAGSGGGPGEVVLPDGRCAWVDGGPRGPIPAAALDGGLVVHRESVELGSLAVEPLPSAPRADLAADQLAAVAHGAGPARIIAPAGSGKTRVLTERLRHLLADRGWDRASVLGVAYNKRAQTELDERTTDFAPRTRTLNSLGLWVLGQARGRAPAVLEETEVRRIVERLAPATRRRVNTDPIGPYLEALGAIRLGLLDPTEVEDSRDDVPGLAELWPGFRRELAERGAVDFDEQIYGAVEALLGDGALRARLQGSCRHLLVDEFQDLTPAHVLLLRVLAAPGLDCFGVGDDDQVIYGHAGADPGFLIGYEELFPGAADHPLEVNYRCPPAVVEAASTLLSYNHRRVPKQIRAGRDDRTDNALTIRLHPPGAGASEVVALVQAWQQEAPEQSVAVLTRVNSLLLAPHVALVDAGVAVSSSARVEVLQRTGIRAALAYLRLATAADGHIDGRDLAEILRRPSRGLPPWLADRLRRRSGWSQRRLFELASSIGDKDAAKLERLVDDVVALRAAAQAGAGSRRLLEQVRIGIGLGGAMTLLDQGKGGEGSSHVDDLQALEEVAGLHDDPATLHTWLLEHLSDGGRDDGVVVSTIHRVKGMEWDRVIVYGTVAGILPHRLAEDDEEERRVLHVGITRARQQAVVLADRDRPSPYLEELTGAAPHRSAEEPVASRSDRSPSLAAAGGRRRAGERDRSSAGRATSRPDAGDADPALAEALRAWRRQRASADQVPAYVVFADRTLFAIATAKPTGLSALRAVDGIGPTKLELYGEEILAVVAPFAS